MGYVFLANNLRRSYVKNATGKTDESPSHITRDTYNKVVSRRQNVKPLTLSNRKYLYSLPEFTDYGRNE